MQYSKDVLKEDFRQGLKQLDREFEMHLLARKVVY